MTLLDGVLIFAILVGILGLIWGIKRASARMEIHAEVQRKLVHVSTGLVALTFPWVFSDYLAVIILLSIGSALMLAMRHSPYLKNMLGSVLHDVPRQSYGEIYLAVSIAVLFLLSEGHPVLYVLPLMLVALSDTASALVGTTYGRKRFPVVEGSKSIEGVVAFFVVSWLCAMVALLLLTDASRVNIIVISALLAAFCALVETDSWRGLDNLFVPLGAHLLLVRYLHTPLSDALVATVVFGFCLLSLRFVAPAFGITLHAARAYVILLFLIVSTAGSFNAVLPLIAIFLHIYANAQRPSADRAADLDVLAVVTCVALFWLVCGALLDRNVINLYNFTFVVASILFASLPLRQAWRVLLIPIAGALTILWSGIVQTNPILSEWAEPNWTWVTAGIALALVVAILDARWLQARRAVKIFSAATLFPLIIYTAQGFFV